VRVYTGLNQKCPQPEWWGETSTEFMGAEDIHLEASLDAIRQATGIDDMRKEESGKRKENTSAADYSLQGVLLPPSSHHLPRIIVRNGKKYFNK
jgi:hypothetical protein